MFVQLIIINCLCLKVNWGRTHKFATNFIFFFLNVKNKILQRQLLNKTLVYAVSYKVHKFKICFLDAQLTLRQFAKRRKLSKVISGRVNQDQVQNESQKKF